ncbi:MAG: 2-oxoacid:acceptor oxidoreductase family protein [Candidatus Aenigmarchaeota archaeon]|nr:2-oxoacid:acceptor oxidoreductase family protein [Candidatus Aenigmarchaeota archaeon]
MDKIIELRIHGRGGQGAKTAGQIIAEAALDNGKHIQAFPEYGPERTGAPMKTYVRISNSEIKTYSPVINPDIVMVIDPTLIGQIDVTSGMTDNDVLIVNTTRSSDKIKEKTGFNGKIYTVDATEISINHLGKNLPNTPMIGALIKVTGVVEMDFLIERVKNTFLDKIGEEKTNANIASIKQAYEEVK